jgi:hypothetical protein
MTAYVKYDAALTKPVAPLAGSSLSLAHADGDADPDAEHKLCVTSTSSISPNYVPLSQVQSDSSRVDK